MFSLNFDFRTLVLDSGHLSVHEGNVIRVFPLFSCSPRVVLLLLMLLLMVVMMLRIAICRIHRYPRGSVRRRKIELLSTLRQSWVSMPRFLPNSHRHSIDWFSDITILIIICKKANLRNRLIIKYINGKSLYCLRN